MDGGFDVILDFVIMFVLRDFEMVCFIGVSVGVGWKEMIIWFWGVVDCVWDGCMMREWSLGNVWGIRYGMWGFDWGWCVCGCGCMN